MYSQEYIKNNLENNGKGILAYAPQVPWIQNKTIKENILFGMPYDEKKYNLVIKKC
jgi:ABC-type multidrug transport system fused ATPase/permease subunit